MQAKPRPTTSAGITNVKDYTKISSTIPLVFKPNTLMTPSSNVLVSIEIISKL